MRLLVVLALVLPACSVSGTIIYENLAEGWEGKLGHFLGPSGCEPARARHGLLTPLDGGRWRAIRSGATSIPCKDGRIEVVVEPAMWLQVAAPALVAVGPVEGARVVGRGPTGRELDLGPEIEWHASGAIELRSTRCAPRESCMDFCGGIEALAKSPDATLFAGARPGNGRLQATWRGVTGTLDVAVH